MAEDEIPPPPSSKPPVSVLPTIRSRPRSSMHSSPIPVRPPIKSITRSAMHSSPLLGSAMASPTVVPNVRHGYIEGSEEFMFQQNRPASLVVPEKMRTFTVRPGLYSVSLLGWPGFFQPSQGSNGMSHQQILAPIKDQAQPSIQQWIPPPMADHNVVKESADISHSDQQSQRSNFTPNKPIDDGYKWRPTGRRTLKGGEHRRKYFRCKHPNCPAKKTVDESLDSLQIIQSINVGQHNHQQPSKHAKDTGFSNGNLNLQGNSELRSNGLPSYLLSTKEKESGKATPDHVSGLCDREEVGNNETTVEGRPESKQRSIEVKLKSQTVREPRFIIQTTSEVDLLDDGYRWHLFGHEDVKGSLLTRSYYECASWGCKVLKHIQRVASDPRKVITTYEGRHNHDVPAALTNSRITASATSQWRPHNDKWKNRIAEQRATGPPNSFSLNQYTSDPSQPIRFFLCKLIYSRDLGRKMSEVFEGYERQYCELSANLSRKCNFAASLPDGEKKKQEISELQSALDDADVLIRKMDLEARSLQPSLKATLLAKLREYKSDLNKLKREVKKLALPISNVPGHEELLESGMAGANLAPANQRERLTMSTERLNQSTDRIKESRRAAFETEELGVSILEDLHQQRETLLHSHKKLYDVDDAIAKSKKILTSMSRRISRNKWIVGSIIAALILAIVVVLYFKFFH
ncbi:V-SNARE [Abeliophyllum distichum]|uniref:V-SNARE n=1 Tax=Abeliophyllum distichum TaxID=126358 RepID=A0ABD1RBV6_9LAMI